tara:strand:+ start:134 stop:1477 length:1344 start_codon:yes stop_codon:yes gene_type:complete
MALERITPPWDNIQVLQKTLSNKSLLDGGKVLLKQNFLPFVSFNWEVIHKNYEENKGFEDYAIKSPLKLWEHKHHFSKLDPRTTRLTDKINFSHWINLKSLNNYTLSKLKKSFDYRYKILSYDLSVSEKAFSQDIVLITGATGNIGTHLVPHLNSLGYKIILLKYDKEASNEYGFDDSPLETHDIVKIKWNPYSKNTIKFPSDIANKIKFAINLSGENILGFWTAAKKKNIVDSRLISTNSILNIIKENRIDLNCCVHSSAIGVYGSNPGKELDEYHTKGAGFLADTTHKWEMEQNKFAEYSKRNINLRIGIVLSLNGGILSAAKIPFKLGIGGYVSPGLNYLSWIGIEDLVRIIGLSLANTSLDGPVNAVAPIPCTNVDFFSKLSEKLKSNITLKIPSYIPRFISKEITDEILISDQFVRPTKLIANKYSFFTPNLNEALDNAFGF